MGSLVVMNLLDYAKVIHYTNVHDTTYQAKCIYLA